MHRFPMLRVSRLTFSTHNAENVFRRCAAAARRIELVVVLIVVGSERVNGVSAPSPIGTVSSHSADCVVYSALIWGHCRVGRHSFATSRNQPCRRECCLERCVFFVSPL